MPGMTAVELPALPPEGTINTEIVAGVAVGLVTRTSLITVVEPETETV